MDDHISVGDKFITLKQMNTFLAGDEKNNLKSNCLSKFWDDALNFIENTTGIKLKEKENISSPLNRDHELNSTPEYFFEKKLILLFSLMNYKECENFSFAFGVSSNENKLTQQITHKNKNYIFNLITFSNNVDNRIQIRAIQKSYLSLIKSNVESPHMETRYRINKLLLSSSKNIEFLNEALEQYIYEKKLATLPLRANALIKKLKEYQSSISSTHEKDKINAEKKIIKEILESQVLEEITAYDFTVRPNHEINIIAESVNEARKVVNDIRNETENLEPLLHKNEELMYESLSLNKRKETTISRALENIDVRSKCISKINTNDIIRDLINLSVKIANKITDISAQYQSQYHKKNPEFLLDINTLKFHCTQFEKLGKMIEIITQKIRKRLSNFNNNKKIKPFNKTNLLKELKKIANGDPQLTMLLPDKIKHDTHKTCTIF